MPSSWFKQERAPPCSARHASGTVWLYNGGMMMKNLLLSAAIAIGIVATQPAFAADYQLDGQLPMYPHAKLDAKESSLTAAAIAQGVPLVLLTSDSIPIVDGWYASRLPKACTRQTASGAIKFACPGGSIMVYSHSGGTQVALVPPIPGMPGGR
jgi:hypothetical protein